MDIEKLGEKIRARLDEMRLSQAELAASLGTSQGIVSAWCNGSLPKSPYLLGIARFLQVSADYLLDDRIAVGDLKASSLSEVETLILNRARVLGPEVALELLYMARPKADTSGEKPWGGNVPPRNPGGLNPKKNARKRKRS